jgi:Mrp family chromosome partitioning ATPase
LYLYPTIGNIKGHSLYTIVRDALKYKVFSEEQGKRLAEELSIYGDIHDLRISDLPDIEKQIEIKRFYYKTREKELQEEVQNVAPLRHKRLIRLLGIVSWSEYRKEFDIKNRKSRK